MSAETNLEPSGKDRGRLQAVQLRSLEAVRAFPVPQLVGIGRDVGVRLEPNQPTGAPGERDDAFVRGQVQHHVSRRDIAGTVVERDVGVERPLAGRIR